MKWLTRAWHGGDLTEEEDAQVNAAYSRHLAEIAPRLRDGAEVLVSAVNLHDGQVQGWQGPSEGVFELRALIGDLQVGYEFITLRYRDADLIGVPPHDFSALGLTHPGAGLLYAEVDIAEDGRFEHRVLCWPDSEFGVRFRSVEVTRRPASPEDRR
ncbi:hypothetical protein LZ198_13385 [Myxococcus sp. K15C18031901]|uniref:hypothetical protein n=1 Tax=Myxococcus dinghuensis TaxID=2906761 RepID=UPI0020A7837A|nr:hypothetical protein [Myxococcus dinghuensis]MCP3099862.1 hypothetical protein [Myxococcus dinghuensis]